ncbi:MAG: hypothetical protein MUF15_02835 [Acidobacteria bacterium]|jgi:hypothetical protein|nr:hypothetical protein [Acidobacteriota bacterium]
MQVRSIESTHKNEGYFIGENKISTTRNMGFGEGVFPRGNNTESTYPIMFVMNDASQKYNEAMKKDLAEMSYKGDIDPMAHYQVIKDELQANQLILPGIQYKALEKPEDPMYAAVCNSCYMCASCSMCATCLLCAGGPFVVATVTTFASTFLAMGSKL